MTKEQLNDQLAAVERDLVIAEENFASATGGPSKVKAKKVVDTLTTNKAELEEKISALETETLDNKAKEEEEAALELADKAKEGEEETDKDELTEKSIVVIKNVGRFMLHNNGTRYPSGMETRTEYTGFVKDQIEANIFVIIEGK